MKLLATHRMRKWTFLLSLLLLLGCQEAEVEITTPIHIATSEWPPYTSQAESRYGIASEIVSAVLEKMNYAPIYSFMPWEQALAASRESDTNVGLRGTFPWFWTEAREADYYLSDPLLSVDLVLFYNEKKSPDLAGGVQLPELSTRATVLTETYAYPRELTRVLENVSRAKTEFRAVERILDPADAAEVMPAVREVGRAIAAELFPGRQADLRVVDNLSWSMDLHFMASRRNPHNKRLMEEFNAALSKVSTEGVPEAALRRARSIEFRRNVVKLSSPGDTQPVLAKEEPAHAEAVRLPRGTRAEVIQWSRRFLQTMPQPGASESSYTRVRILNGPLRGRILYVQDLYIELP